MRSKKSNLKAEKRSKGQFDYFILSCESEDFLGEKASLSWMYLFNVVFSWTYKFHPIFLNLLLPTLETFTTFTTLTVNLPMNNSIASQSPLKILHHFTILPIRSLTFDYIVVILCRFMHSCHFSPFQTPL